METVRATWYEAWIKRSFGGKLIDRYSNQEEAKAAIKKAVEKEKSLGYKPSEYYPMIVDVIKTMDDEGETISETITYARV